jgi:D-sedoheptulose 7-phosphate isomerase
MDPVLADLAKRHPALAPVVPVIGEGFRLLQETFAAGGTLLLCGNGGSAADAEHWAAELLKGFVSPRPLAEETRRGLDAALAHRLQGALPAVALPAFSVFVSAYGNDVDPVAAYAQLVHALGKPGDALVGLSTSGRSENVLLAFDVARARGMRTLALTGAEGGKLAPLADVAIRVPAEETERVQELHLPIYHALSRMLETAFFG